MEAVLQGSHYAEVGKMVAERVGGDPEGSLLYVEIEPGMIGCSIFKDVGAKIVYRDCGIDLTMKVYRAWFDLPETQRWTTMSYVVNGGRFSASFEFPDDLLPEEELDDRRPRVVKARFGDKPVDYSDP